MPYLVRLVVVLRVVLEHFCLLSVVEGADELVEIEILAPLLTLDEPVSVLARGGGGRGSITHAHFLCQGHIELAGS